MRNLMILSLMVFTTNMFLTAQVKDQFRDTSNTSTIVVVKEDNANDQKVLNEYFDLSDMSMNDQIMITTLPSQDSTTNPPDMSTATASTASDIETFFEDYDTEEVKVETEIPLEEGIVDETKPEIVVASNKTKVKARTPVRNNVRKSTSRAKGTYKKKSTARVKRAAQKKYYGKKKRKKNKKRRKFFGNKKSKGCYNF